MKIGTEINPISFTINNFTFRMGMAYFADIQLLVYDDYKHIYGGDLIISDYMRINMHFDFIWDEKLKFRWTPMFHECAHVSGDYQSDPGFGDEGKKTIADLGIEGMMFELYYNWRFFTFYGGIQFVYEMDGEDAYSTIFGFHIGTDVRIPVWGHINFVTGIHFGLNYDVVRIMTIIADDITPVSETRGWYPVIVIGAGFEFDRFTISAKYSLMRSRHMISYTTMEEKVGIDISIFF